MHENEFFFRMTSVKSLTQEWTNLVLSKPAMATELDTKYDKIKLSKVDEIKYVVYSCSIILCRLRIELESRQKETESLTDQLVSTQQRFRESQCKRVSLENRRKALCDQNESLEAEIWKLVEASDSNRHANDSRLNEKVPSRSREHDRIMREFKSGKVFAESESLRKLNHVVGTIVSRNSTRLSSMMSDRCDSEMDRTRKIDHLIQSEQSMLSVELEKLRDISKYMQESMEIRRQYDQEIQDDFRSLVDLSMAVDSLTKDVSVYQQKDSRRSLKQSGFGKKTTNLSSSRIVELQTRVNALQQQVADAEERVAKESKKLNSDLTSIKVEKRNLKTKFQSDIKSIFADLTFLAGRIDRTESNLEKANIHYQLDEEEIVNIVSPIIDGIDGLRERLDSIFRDAEEIFYGN